MLSCIGVRFLDEFVVHLDEFVVHIEMLDWLIGKWQVQKWQVQKWQVRAECFSGS